MPLKVLAEAMEKVLCGREGARVSPLYILLGLVPVAVAFRYFVEQTKRRGSSGLGSPRPITLRINKDGFQDAVSIPEANASFCLLLVLFEGGLLWLAVGFGWLWILAGVLVAVMSSSFAQVLFLPKKRRSALRHTDLRLHGETLRGFLSGMETKHARGRCRICWSVLSKSTHPLGLPQTVSSARADHRRSREGLRSCSGRNRNRRRRS